MKFTKKLSSEVLAELSELPVRKNRAIERSLKYDQLIKNFDFLNMVFNIWKIAFRRFFSVGSPDWIA